jgi:hypothetical protein
MVVQDFRGITARYLNISLSTIIPGYVLLNASFAAAGIGVCLSPKIGHLCGNSLCSRTGNSWRENRGEKYRNRVFLFRPGESGVLLPKVRFGRWN